MAIVRCSTCYQSERREYSRFALVTCEPVSIGGERLWKNLERPDSTARDERSRATLGAPGIEDANPRMTDRECDAQVRRH